MSNETPNPEETAVPVDPEGTPKRPSKAILYGVVGASLLLGGTVGAVVIAPRVRPPEQITVTAGSGEAHAEEEGAGGEGKGRNAQEVGRIVRFDNLIVNPAGSQGARFLLVSVAIEAADAKIEEQLRSRDVQIRDAIEAVLERQTMEILSQAGIRDTIKRRLADTVTALTKGGGKLKVYLPQFVIQ